MTMKILWTFLLWKRIVRKMNFFPLCLKKCIKEPGAAVWIQINHLSKNYGKKQSFIISLYAWTGKPVLVSWEKMAVAIPLFIHSCWYAARQERRISL